MHRTTDQSQRQQERARDGKGFAIKLIGKHEENRWSKSNRRAANGEAMAHPNAAIRKPPPTAGGQIG